MKRLILRKSSLFLIIILLTITGFSVQFATAGSSVTIEEKPYAPLIRNWDDISLLYDGTYHNSSRLDEEIDRIQTLVPDLVDISTIGHSYQGKELRVLRITNENRDYQKAKTMVVAHHHGREQISIETALRFILYLLNNYQENPMITDFIDHQEIFIIPTVNPDALDRVVDLEDYFLRKNLRPWDDDGDGFFEEDHRDDVNMDGIISSFDVYDNSNPSDPTYLYTYYEGIDNDGDGKINEDTYGYTDLNRNYDSYWRDGDGWEDDTQSQIYPGLTPFSEPETQAVRNFMLNHRFGMAYSLHSGTNATLFPTGDYGFPEYTLYTSMIQDFREILPFSYTAVYYDPNSPNNVNREPATALAGSWDTWAYFERDVLAPITFELYRNLSSVLPSAETVLEENSTHLILEWTEIFGYFTPEDEYIDALWNDVRPGFDYLLNNTPRLDHEFEIAFKRGSTNEIQITVRSENISPMIKTMEQILFLDSNDTLLEHHGFLSAEYIYNFETSLYLSDMVEVDGKYPLKIGNEYVGYQEFIIDPEGTQDTNSGFTISLSILGVIFISTFSIKIKRKRR